MKVESNIHGIIVPHAPTLLAEKIDDQSSSVIAALQDCGKRMKEWGVEVVVAVTTHWQTEDKFFIDNSSLHETLMEYSNCETKFAYDVFGHPELAELLLRAGEKNLIFPSIRKHGTDHAIAIPLHFMFPEKNIPVIPLSVSGSMLCSFRWGRTLRNTLRKWGGKVLFLASGSLFHDFNCFMSGKMLMEHEKLDWQVLKLLSEGKGMDILGIDQELMGIAKLEGDFRDLFMLLGVMGSQTQGKIRAYEKLPGVGLGIIEFADSSDDGGMDKAFLKLAPHFGILH
jgi:aromatic ring-opening dioxygenase catalytic subunit (LigB family)